MGTWSEKTEAPEPLLQAGGIRTLGSWPHFVWLCRTQCPRPPVPCVCLFFIDSSNCGHRKQCSKQNLASAGCFSSCCLVSESIHISHQGAQPTYHYHGCYIREHKAGGGSGLRHTRFCFVFLISVCLFFLRL